MIAANILAGRHVLHSSRRLASLTASSISVKDFLPKPMGDQEDEVTIAQTELNLMQVKLDSPVKTVYLQYKKHASLYHPSIYRAANADEKMKELNSVYIKVLNAKLSMDNCTDEDRIELNMLMKQNYGLINYNAKTLTDEIKEIDDNRHDWMPKEPKNYLFFIFSAWAALGFASFAIDQ